jgi:lysophospholipase L1-like esterase
MARRAALKRALALVGLVLGGVLAALALVESGVLLLLRHPAWLSHLSPRVTWIVRHEIYFSLEAHVVQLEHGRYDPEVTYTLTPGRFVFANREFADEFRVNSLGVRDDEESLRAPEVVVLGDSFAMGWGVRQDQTYAKLLQARLGRRVLDAAVSSYGTVRELKLLDRIDLSAARAVVIQYCANDTGENRAFQEAGGRLRVMDRATFERNQREQLRRSYWFGKYALSILRRENSWGGPRPVTGTEQAQAFLYALQHATKQDLTRVRLVVHDAYWTPFLRALAAELKRPEYPAYLRAMTLVDVADKLTPGSFYPLDGHYNAAGHRTVADELERVLR